MLGVSRECGVKYLRVMKYCMFGLFEPKIKKMQESDPEGNLPLWLYVKLFWW